MHRRRASGAASGAGDNRRSPARRCRAGSAAAATASAVARPIADTSEVVSELLRGRRYPRYRGPAVVSLLLREIRKPCDQCGSTKRHYRRSGENQGVHARASAVGRVLGRGAGSTYGG